jgi:hypothetical protein
MDPGLLAAYRRAIYRVHLPAGDLDLRAGECSPELDRRLAARGERRWAWLTAVNPRSERLPEAENRRRQEELGTALAARGWTVLDGTAIDPDGSWPDEPSFFVLGILPDAARELALGAGQLAFLTGELGAPVTLRTVAGPAAADEP